MYIPNTGSLVYEEPALPSNSDNVSIKLDNLAYARTETATRFTIDSSSTWSMECWFEIETLPPSGKDQIIGLVGDNSPTGEMKFVQVDNTGVVTLAYFNTAGAYIGGNVTGAGEVTAGTPYYLTVTHDGAGRMKLYINSVEKLNFVQTTPRDWNELSRLWVLSGPNSGSDTGVNSGEITDGWADEFAVYTTELQQADVTEHYNAGT